MAGKKTTSQQQEQLSLSGTPDHTALTDAMTQAAYSDYGAENVNVPDEKSTPLENLDLALLQAHKHVRRIRTGMARRA